MLDLELFRLFDHLINPQVNRHPPLPPSLPPGLNHPLPPVLFPAAS